MRHWICLLVVSLAIVAVCAQNHEDLFTLTWGEQQNQLGLHVENLGNVSHEEGYFTLRYGPQAIAVSQDGKEIYILDRVRDRIAVFTNKGEFLRQYAVPSEFLGLAIAQEKTLVAFSPMDKCAVVVGKDSPRMQAPANFAALSEVWFIGQEVWGRYGCEAARLDEPDSRKASSFCHASAVDENKLALGISEGDRSDNYTIVEMPQSFSNCYASGAKLANDRMFLTLVGISGERQQNKNLYAVICDKSGKSSGIIALTTPWTSCFAGYTCIDDGTVYEMVIAETGTTVRKWNATELNSDRKIRDNVPATEVRSETASEGGSRRTINVWFRENNVVRTMDLEEYLKGVVSQEIYGSWLLETHKSMAVAARTYAVARYRHPEKSPQAHVCNSTCCQAWTSQPTSKAIQAVNATAGQYIYSGSSTIKEALYFSHCSGNTRNSENYDSWNYIAYLRSRPCSCGWTWYFGHGVGMCQYGMEAYAKKGWNYQQIIQHYYTGCSVK